MVSVKTLEWFRPSGVGVFPLLFRTRLSPTRLRRLEFLSRHLAHTISPESPLRYQLLHRTVSAVLEAQMNGAAAALVLVRSFGVDAGDNFVDFGNFVGEMGGDTLSKDQSRGRTS